MQVRYTPRGKQGRKDFRVGLSVLLSTVSFVIVEIISSIGFPRGTREQKYPFAIAASEFCRLVPMLD